MTRLPRQRIMTRLPRQRIAALFVDAKGCYAGLDGVDVWDITRDARLYDDHFPIVAHPPCQRWGTYFHGCCPVGSSRRRKLGDDDGCFESALSNVRRFGGVLEHPKGSRAFSHFGLGKPRDGWWFPSDDGRGYITQVYQSRYGHVGGKPTWLYAVDCNFDLLLWGQLKTDVSVDGMSAKERAATPVAFRDMLLALAFSVYENR